jgi:hypothetical protein
LIDFVERAQRCGRVRLGVAGQGRLAGWGNAG